MEPNKELRYILSIDIGIRNLAMVLLECEKDYQIRDVIWFELIDITVFCHLDKESRNNCSLYHTRTISDWLSHVVYLNTELFELCELVLIEKQPPQGHVCVEQLLFFQFRKKAVLIYPRSVHKFFSWGPEVDYESRKKKSIEILLHRLEKTERSWLYENLENMPRKHDISDAYIQAVYFLSKKRREYLSTNSNLDEKDDKLGFLNKFKFIENVSFREEIL